MAIDIDNLIEQELLHIPLHDDRSFQANVTAHSKG